MRASSNCRAEPDFRVVGKRLVFTSGVKDVPLISVSEKLGQVVWVTLTNVCGPGQYQKMAVKFSALGHITDRTETWVPPLQSRTIAAASFADMPIPWTIDIQTEQHGYFNGGCATTAYTVESDYVP